MAITFFGATSTPTDNGDNTGTTCTITPPGSMAAGMLVLVTLLVRQSTIGWDEFYITTSGGQDWMEMTTEVFGRTNLSGKLYCCIFNGTWSANPVFTGPTSVPFIGHMQVYQHDSGSGYRFKYDLYPKLGTFVAGTTPFTKTITGRTLNTSGAVAIAVWASADDNTWDSLTANWAYSNPGGINQVRDNGASTADISMTSAYQVFSGGGATGNVAVNQATLGGDAGLTAFMAFSLEAVPTFAVPTCDVIVDGENSTDGTTLTTTILTAMTKPASPGGSWATSGGTPTNTYVETDGENLMSPNSVVVNSVTYDAGSTRGVRYDHTAGTATPSWLFTFDSTKAVISVGFWFKTTHAYGVFDSFSSMAILSGGSEFAVWNFIAQHADSHSSRLETNSAPGEVLGPRLVNNQWYWVTIRVNITGGDAWMSVYTWSGSAWVLQGMTITCPVSTASNISYFQVFCSGGDYTNQTGNSYYDDILIDYSGDFPLIPGQTAAASGIGSGRAPGYFPGAGPNPGMRFRRSEQYPQAIPTVVFRKTVSPIGTRTGARQTHNT